VNEPEKLPRSLAALAAALRERRLSPVEVVNALLKRIESEDAKLNAFVTVLPERALEEAARAEEEILAGEYRGPLHGIPIGIKDLIYTKGIRTTMGSAFFEDYVPDHSATVVSKLEEAGAILIGKTNTHEFAYGPTGDRSRFGPTRNPRDLSRIPGGSSGGSGAAVAAELCYAALGSDTAASIRVPAALCGVVGMKPTFGRVSKSGAFPLAWTLDHVGPITRIVEDNALLLNALAGYDEQDPFSVDRPTEDFTRDLQRNVRGGVVGVPARHYFEHVEGEVERMVTEAVEVFRSLGAEVREVEVPHLSEALKAQRIILAVEAYTIHKERLENEPERFGDEISERLRDAEHLKAHRYAKAQQVIKRRSLEEFGRVLEEVDVLLTPTTPIAATNIGQREVNIGGHEELVFSALTRFTGPTNLNGLPSLSVPCGLTHSGLPVGLQIIGRPFDEATVYRYGHAYETAAPAVSRPP
jgi:aspartyl-tRNA(Asn)/glutamyl-tRNA(Gln) amidotransferase subunit A